MATVSPANFSPGDTTGYLEDVSKLAPRLIDPWDCPVYKGLAKTKAKAPLHEFLTDALPTLALQTPPIFDTELASYSTTLNRARPGNRVQLFRTTWSISEFSEILAGMGGIGGGITSEVQREIERQIKFLSKVIEFTILSEQAVATDSGTGGAGAALAGFFAAVSGVNTNVTDSGAVTIPNAVAESDFQTKIKALYAAGGTAPFWAVMQPSMAATIGANWIGRVNTQEVQQRGKHEVDTVVETYISPVGGQANITPDRSMGPGLAIIDKTQVKVAEATAIRVFERDPDSFQNRQGRISTYLTMEWGQEKASGGWKDNSTPAANGDTQVIE